MITDRIVTLEQIKKDIKTHEDIYEIAPYSFEMGKLHEYHNCDGTHYYVDAKDGEVFYRSDDPQESDKHVSTACNKNEFAQFVYSEKDK